MIVVDISLNVKMILGKELKKRAWLKQNFDEGNLGEALVPEINSLMDSFWKVAREGTQVSTEFARDDSYYTLQIIPLQYEDMKVYGFLVIFQNITEAKIRETQLHLSKDAAEEANQAKSNFIANMSHEIRTPLNGIIGFAEQLAKTKLTKKQAHYLEIIQNSSRHLGIIIDDILTISRFEALEMHIDEVSFSLRQLIEEVEKVVAFRFNEKKVDYHHYLDPELEITLLGDPTKIKQVLINIVTNAIKFTDEGSVELRCELLDTKKEIKIVRFEITDTGIGIPKDKLNDIFEPFHQVDSAITRKYKGTGLGLTISKKMVEAMGGKIKVTSKAGEGTSFTFTLPLGISELPAAVQKEKLPGASLKTLCENKKVLLVDDDAVNRLLGTVILNEAGIKPVVAVNGKEALEQYHNERFDLILLDIQMPEISGIDVAIAIRKDEKEKENKVKILAMTANVLRKDLQYYLASGFDDYLLKPFTEQSLHNKLRKHFSGKVKPRNPQKAYNPRLKQEDRIYLENLESVTKGDKGFMLRMIDTFLDNTAGHYILMEKALEEKDYRRIGEIAHKLVPSFRHLNLNSVAEQLSVVENNLLRNDKHEGSLLLIRDLMRNLRKSMEKIKQVKSGLV